MNTNSDVDFYLAMRRKYKTEHVDVIDSLWSRASAKLGSIGLTVYTDEGQELIATDYLNYFKY